MTDLKESLISTILEACTPSKPDISDHDKPFIDAGIDSLDFAGILMALEDKYAIKIENEDMPELNSVNKIVHYLEALGK